MIGILQAGRFLAASAVVIHHANQSVGAFLGGIPQLYEEILDYGYLGVDFFFVLSGFIIHFSMHQHPRPAINFATDRFLRIMIPYWPVAILLALSYSVFPSMSASGREWGWLPTLTLLPTDLPPSLSVAWTLQHELIFYLLYAILFYMRKLRVGLAIWAALILINSFMELSYIPFIKYALSPINSEFIAGVAAATAFLSTKRIPLLLSTSAAFALTWLFHLSGALRSESWMVGLSIAILLPALCSYEREGTLSVPKWLVYGGSISYSLYLVHNPLISALSRIFEKLELTWMPALLSCYLISLVSGIFWFKIWETPALHLVKRRFRRTT